MTRPEDDSFHLGSTDPYWNESAWFGFNVPERKINGWVYFYHRPNMNYTVGGVAVWDPSGEYQWDCLHYNWGETIALPAGADMFDFTLDNGLAVACKQPLQTFQLNYTGDGCAVDLTFDAVAAPQEARRGGAAGLPSGTDDWGRGHYNQPGRMVGTLELGGERIPVDCFTARDRSWGPRRFTTNPRGSFATAVASERSGFLSMAVSAQPRESDPCSGVADPVLFGWYLRDGTPSLLVSGTRTVVERDGRGRPLHVVVEAVDELGRELRAEGRARTWLWWHGYAFMFQFWTQLEWTFDGQTAIGEDQDFFPIQQARRFVRGLPR